MGKIVVSDSVSLDGVIQDPAGDEGFRVGGWVGQIKDREELGKLTRDEALGTEACCRPAEHSGSLRGGRSAVASGGQDKQPAQVRRVLDPRTSQLEQLGSPEGDVLNEVSKLKQELSRKLLSGPASSSCTS